MGRHQQFERRVGEARFLLAADSGIVVEFGSRIDRALSDKVLRLRDALRLKGLQGVTDLIPTFRSLLVQYDPLLADPLRLIDEIAGLLESTAKAETASRLWRLPVCYEEQHAPDLADVAGRVNMTVADVVDLHSSQEYFVYFLGFLPGCALMGDLPAELELPRRTEPRIRVPAGSLAIAMRLTLVYPLVSPGGWHLIGNCPLKFFHSGLQSPNLLAPGDKVGFRPVSSREYEDILHKENEAKSFEYTQDYLVT